MHFWFIDTFDAFEQHLNHQTCGSGNIEDQANEPITYVNGGFDEGNFILSTGKLEVSRKGIILFR